MLLEGQVMLIAGGGRGIGRATALACAGAGVEGVEEFAIRNLW